MTVRQDPAELVARLGHPLEDVRLRALRILRSKLEIKTLSPRALYQSAPRDVIGTLKSLLQGPPHVCVEALGCVCCLARDPVTLDAVVRADILSLLGNLQLSDAPEVRRAAARAKEAAVAQMAELGDMDDSECTPGKETWPDKSRVLHLPGGQVSLPYRPLASSLTPQPLDLGGWVLPVAQLSTAEHQELLDCSVKAQQRQDPASVCLAFEAMAQALRAGMPPTPVVAEEALHASALAALSAPEDAGPVATASLRFLEILGVGLWEALRAASDPALAPPRPGPGRDGGGWSGPLTQNADSDGVSSAPGGQGGKGAGHLTASVSLSAHAHAVAAAAAPLLANRARMGAAAACVRAQLPLLRPPGEGITAAQCGMFGVHLGALWGAARSLAELERAQQDGDGADLAWSSARICAISLLVDVAACVPSPALAAVVPADAARGLVQAYTDPRLPLAAPHLVARLDAVVAALDPEAHRAVAMAHRALQSRETWQSLERGVLMAAAAIGRGNNPPLATAMHLLRRCEELLPVLPSHPRLPAVAVTLVDALAVASIAAAAIGGNPGAAEANRESAGDAPDSGAGATASGQPAASDSGTATVPPSALWGQAESVLLRALTAECGEVREAVLRHLERLCVSGSRPQWEDGRGEGGRMQGALDTIARAAVSPAMRVGALTLACMASGLPRLLMCDSLARPAMRAQTSRFVSVLATHLSWETRARRKRPHGSTSPALAPGLATAALRGLHRWSPSLEALLCDKECAGFARTALHVLSRDGAGAAVAPNARWSAVAAAVRRLMSRSDRARLDAASSLAATLGIRPTPAALQSLASLATPADGSCKAAATSITARSGLDSAALARALTNEDVARLLALFRSPSQDPEVRRSAADQLTSIASQPSRSSVAASSDVVKAALQVAHATAASAGSPTAPEARLLRASLALLAACVLASAQVRTALAQCTDQSLLPLAPVALSPSQALSATALLVLSAVAFHQDACHVDSDTAHQAPPAHVAVTQLACEGFHVPFPTVRVPERPETQPGRGEEDQRRGSAGKVDGQAASPAAKQSAAPGGATTRQPELAAEMRSVCKAYGDGLWRLAEAGHAIPAAASGGLWGRRIAALLSDLSRASTSREACAAADALLDSCGADAGAADALAASAWGEPLRRYLDVPPQSVSDHQLCAKVLAILAVIVANPAIVSSDFVLASLSLRKCLFPVLEAGCPTLPRVPLALVRYHVASLQGGGGATGEHQREEAVLARVDLLSQGLTTLSALLRATAARGSRVCRRQVAATCSEGRAVGSLVEGFVRDRAAPPALRVMALGCLVHLAELAGSIRGGGPSETTLVDTLARSLMPVIEAASMERLEGPDESRLRQLAVAFGDEASVLRRRAMVRAGAGEAGHPLTHTLSTCRALRGQGLALLQACAGVVGRGDLSRAWSRGGSSFWLACMTRDADAAVRSDALFALAMLLALDSSPYRLHAKRPAASLSTVSPQPRSREPLRWDCAGAILAAWPEVATAAARVAADTEEAPAVRAGALAVLAAIVEGAAAAVEGSGEDEGLGRGTEMTEDVRGAANVASAGGGGALEGDDTAAETAVLTTSHKNADEPGGEGAIHGAAVGCRAGPYAALCTAVRSNGALWAAVGSMVSGAAESDAPHPVIARELFRLLHALVAVDPGLAWRTMGGQRWAAGMAAVVASAAQYSTARPECDAAMDAAAWAAALVERAARGVEGGKAAAAGGMQPWIEATAAFLSSEAAAEAARSLQACLSEGASTAGAAARAARGCRSVQAVLSTAGMVLACAAPQDTVPVLRGCVGPTAARNVALLLKAYADALHASEDARAAVARDDSLMGAASSLCSFVSLVCRTQSAAETLACDADNTASLTLAYVRVFLLAATKLSRSLAGRTSGALRVTKASAVTCPPAPRVVVNTQEHPASSRAAEGKVGTAAAGRGAARRKAPGATGTGRRRDVAAEPADAPVEGRAATAEAAGKEVVAAALSADVAGAVADPPRGMQAGAATSSPGQAGIVQSMTSAAAALQALFAQSPGDAAADTATDAGLPHLSVALCQDTVSSMLLAGAAGSDMESAGVDLLATCVSVLRFLCLRSQRARTAVASAGVFGCLETFWGIALRHPRLRHEVLGLCANAWTQCGAAVQAACACASRSTTAIDPARFKEESGAPTAARIAKGSVMSSVLQVVARGHQTHGTETACLALACVKALCSSTEGVLVVTTSAAVADVTRHLQAEASAPAHRRDPAATAAALGALARLAGTPPGAAALLRAGRGPPGGSESVVALAAELSASDAAPAQREAALVMLRALAAHPAAKAHFVACPAALNALVSAVGLGPRDLTSCAVALEALWWLLHGGERVAVALKSGGGALAERAGDVARGLRLAGDEAQGLDPAVRRIADRARSAAKAVVALLGEGGWVRASEATREPGVRVEARAA